MSKHLNYISIFDFEEWDKVEDYESDEFSVILFDKNHNILAEFGYSGFTADDLNNFKINYGNKINSVKNIS